MVYDDTSQLKAHLKALRADLADADRGEVDEELRGLLRQLDGDIHNLLEKRAAIPPEEDVPPGLATRTQELAARFAAEHPRMEPALRELGRMLSNMGI